MYSDLSNNIAVLFGRSEYIQSQLETNCYNSFSLSIPVNKLGDYPIWLVMYIAQIVLPMIGLSAIAIKIVLKNGKDMRRELLGVDVQVITNEKITMVLQP